MNQTTVNAKKTTESSNSDSRTNNHSHQNLNKRDTINTRAHVIKTLLNVQSGLSLSKMLDGLLADVANDDKPFVHNLLLTTLRHWHATARLLDTLADNPIDEIEVRTTIQVGISQLVYLEVADHASIFETVEAVKAIDFARASGLVNAILRKVAKNPNKYRKICDKKHSLPNWLAKQLKYDWKEQYNELCKGLRQPAPMFLRVNARQTSVTEYIDQLTQADIDFDALNLTTKLTDSAQHGEQTTTQPIRLQQSQSVKTLPNFTEGMVSIQDAHANLAGATVKLLTDKLLTETKNDSLHILDACTAPSGKLAHCLELFPSNKIVKVIQNKIGMDADGNDKFALQHDSKSTGSIRFTALDNAQLRLNRSTETLTRLNLADEALLICGDATQWISQAEDSEQFDIILLDAPCTATGVIRRHPDIGLLRLETDIEQTVTLQKEILDNLWAQLRPNGYLVYATCSILKAENETQMQNFVDSQINTNYLAKEVKVNGNWGMEQTIGRQSLPLNADEGDGFYYAVLQKVKK